MKMTDQELKDLVASLAEEHKKIAEEQKITEAIIRSLSEEHKKIAEEQKKTDKQMKRTDEQMKRTDEQMKRTDEQMKRTDEQMKRTDAKLERMGINLANIGENNGAVAEDFFFSSLVKKKKLGNIKYDYIAPNWSKNLKNVRGEYDIVCINGKEVALVEVKYKAHLSDVEKMAKQIESFKILFPDYKDFTVRGTLAGMSMSKEVEEEALKNGYFVLKQQGDHMEVSSPF